MVQKNAYASSSRRRLDDDIDVQSSRSNDSTSRLRNGNERRRMMTNENGRRNQKEDDVDVDVDDQIDADHEDGQEGASENESGHEDEELGQGWTKETFQDQPVRKGGSDTIVSACKDIAQLIRKIDAGLEAAAEAAKAIEDANGDENSIAEVETYFLQLLEQRALATINNNVLEDLMQRFRQNEAIINLEEEITTECRKKQHFYRSKTKRQKFKNEKLYIEFRQSIWEINHMHEPCPNITTWLPREAGDDDDDDEDFQTGGVTQQYRCPITMRTLQDACVNESCKHSYSWEGIMGYIATQKGKGPYKCPYAGCNKNISKTSVKRDPALQKRADEYERRLHRHERQTMGADDIEEL